MSCLTLIYSIRFRFLTETLYLIYKINICQQVTCLSLLGGHTVAQVVRRILASLGGNALWSCYSLKGQKGKRALRELPIMDAIISK